MTEPVLIWPSMQNNLACRVPPMFRKIVISACRDLQTVPRQHP